MSSDLTATSNHVLQRTKARVRVFSVAGSVLASFCSLSLAASGARRAQGDESVWYRGKVIHFEFAPVLYLGMLNPT